MKILIISDAWKPQVNGVVRTYEHIGNELEKTGHEFHVIGPADFPFRIPMPGYPEIKLALAPYGRLQRMIKSFSPDVIHIGTEGPLGQAGRQYCIKNNLRFTTIYHSHFPDYVAGRVAKFAPCMASPVRNFAIKKLRHFHGSAAAMMIATQSLEDELKEWGFKTPMHRLTRGVHLHLFKPGEVELFHDMPRPVALYVGRVAVEKNLEDFLSMDWKGSKVIVGHGPDFDKLKNKYPDPYFTGTKEGEELAAHYRSADLFVFPSKTDTFGMVLTEALASGLPVAAYDVTGPRDIITAPHLGALHEDNLAHAANKALEVMDQKKERHKHVRENYTWPSVAKQFLKVLEETGL